MFDPAPSTWTGGLRRSPAQANLPILTFEDLCELFTPQASRRSSINTEMDATSPTSPVSAVSPTQSEQSLTPTTPKVLSFDLLWEQSRPQVNLPLLPKSKASSFNSNKVRRLTVDHTQASSNIFTPAERWSRRRTEEAALGRIRMSLPEINLKQSTEQPSHDQEVDGDGDGDAAMSRPKAIAQPESDQDRRRSARVHKMKLSAVEDRGLYDEDVESNPVTSIVSTTSTIPNSRILLSSTIPHKTQVGDIMPPPELSKHRRSSLFSQRGRSQDRTAAKAHRRTASNSQSCSRINKTSSRKALRIEVQVPDPRKAQLKNSILHLGIPLVPLISVTTGLPHPDFPRTILQYHLLTHDQLDSLARWYHQTVDNTRERYMYPAVIERAWVWQDERLQSYAEERMSAAGIEEQNKAKQLELSKKRRRFGRFIGLRGCESPTFPGPVTKEDAEQDEDVAEQMEREWKAALKRAEEEERLQDKLWRGRW